MKPNHNLGFSLLLAISFIFLLAGSGSGYEITDTLSVGGVIAGAFQYQSISDAPGLQNKGKGA